MTAHAWVVAAALSLVALPAIAQSTQRKDESEFRGEFRTEGERVAEDCSSAAPKRLVGCAVTLVTDHPVHVSLGSIAPQNGFGFGGAMTWTSNTPDSPWSLSGDAVKAFAGAWRAGAYLKVRQADRSGIEVVGPGQGSNATDFIRTIPLYNAYVQAISLPTIPFYGLGNDNRREEVRFFSMRQTIVGGSVTYPIKIGSQSRLAVALLGDANGRFVRTEGSDTDRGPSLTPSARSIAAGFGVDHGFAQFSEGARAKLALGPRVRLNYLGQFQQFMTASEADLNFRRWTVDLGHEVSLYRRFKPSSNAEQFTPNDCELKKDGRCLPDIEKFRRDDRSWNRSGSIGFRVFLSQSQTSGENVVPFYFQQTLGGSDINGARSLASYEDYRFRGPKLLMFQESFEHIIAGPVGAFVELTHGRVGLQRESLTSDLRHSFAVGASLNAGAAPMLTMFWATGGPEGNHFGVVMNTALLGGGSRPSLH